MTTLEPSIKEMVNAYASLQCPGYEVFYDFMAEQHGEAFDEVLPLMPVIYTASLKMKPLREKIDRFVASLARFDDRDSAELIKGVWGPENLESCVFAVYRGNKLTERNLADMLGYLVNGGKVD